MKMSSHCSWRSYVHVSLRSLLGPILLFAVALGWLVHSAEVQRKAVDAGLAHLKSLTGLQVLSLTGTKITDSGLIHLKGLTGLRVLYLNPTGTLVKSSLVTNAAVQDLQDSLPDLQIIY
jgi:hypothetical protein